MSDATDYYEVLGVDRTATSDDIKRAYRKLARKHHPDINKDPASEARFKEISEANEVLSNPELREKYDAFGPEFCHVPDDVDPEAWANAQHMRDQHMRDTSGQAPPGWQEDLDDEALQDFLDELLVELPIVAVVDRLDRSHQSLLCCWCEGPTSTVYDLSGNKSPIER